MQEIQFEELRERLRRGSLTVLDVLPRPSWLAGHIPGAVHLPLEELPARAGTVLPDREREIAVYCAGFS